MLQCALLLMFLLASVCVSLSLSLPLHWHSKQTFDSLALVECNISFRYWDPYYYRRQRKQSEGGGMNFIESVCEKINLVLSTCFFSLLEHF